MGTQASTLVALDGARLSWHNISGLTLKIVLTMYLSLYLPHLPTGQGKKRYSVECSCSHPLSPLIYNVLLFSPRAFRVLDHTYAHSHTCTPYLAQLQAGTRPRRTPTTPLQTPPPLPPPPSALHVDAPRRQEVALPTSPSLVPAVGGKARPRGRTDIAGVQSSPVLPPRREGAAARTGPMSGEPEWDFLPESRWPE